MWILFSVPNINDFILNPRKPKICKSYEFLYTFQLVKSYSNISTNNDFFDDGDKKFIVFKIDLFPYVQLLGMI
jgi:hypothetical protein